MIEMLLLFLHYNEAEQFLILLKLFLIQPSSSSAALNVRILIVGLGMKKMLTCTG